MDSKCNNETTNKQDNKDGGVDKYKRFEDEGVIFKAKLIGTELVLEPRGDKMCQNSIQRLKAIIKGTNSHKKRIVLKISYDGVKVLDEKANEILHHHQVSQISYIASDDTDSRTFGYVCDVNKAHQFICFKTSGPAINVMSVISSLFEAVLERKNQKEEVKESEQLVDQSNLEKLTSIQQPQDSMDLIGDSGIMEGDASIGSVNSINGGAFSAGQNSQQDYILLPPPASLPRPVPVMRQSTTAGPTHNRSLVYNHSSVSLSDAVLTRQSSFAGTTSHKNDSQVDRYAVFNNIDSFPSIFEATSSGSVNNVGQVASSAPVDPVGMSGYLFGQPQGQTASTTINSHHNYAAYANNQPKMMMQGAGVSSGANLAHLAFSQSFGNQPTQSQQQRFQRQPPPLIPAFGSATISTGNVVVRSDSSGGLMSASSSTTDASMFRQTNPFDDDFFN